MIGAATRFKRVFFVCVLALALGTQSPGPAQAQSSSTITVNGIEITVMGGSSQSISTNETGAEITLDGRTIIIDGSKVSVGGSSFDSGPFDKLVIDATGGSLKILVDGELRFETSATAQSDLSEGAKLNNQGVAYFNGDGVEQSYEKAVEFYERAANDHGDTTAANNLAIIFWYGVDGIPADRERAMQYAPAAAEAGQPSALYFMARAHLDGISVAPNPQLGLDYLDQAVAAGHSNALVDLGNLHKNGEHVEKDLAKSTDLYRRAAEDGNGAGANNYAWSLWNGDGVDTNPTEAIAYAETAASAGYNSANFLLGLIHYFGGDGVEVSYPKALEYFTLAAERGDATAAFNLGIMYRDGQGTAPNLDAAISWMTQAAELGDPNAPEQVERLKARAAE